MDARKHATGHQAMDARKHATGHATGRQNQLEMQGKDWTKDPDCIRLKKACGMSLSDEENRIWEEHYGNSNK